MRTVRILAAIVLAAGATLAGDGPHAVWTGPGVNLLGSPSRDGRWLSFVDAETGDLFLRSLADGRLLRVTANDQPNQFAYFSVIAPKGDQAAFAWFNEEGFYELRLASLPQEGSEPQPARTLYRNPEAGFVQPCAFSPDGSQILTLFFRRDNISQIALVSTADGSVRTLRSLNWIYPKRMDFSPDGRFIVYDNAFSDGAGERDLFVLAVDGSTETRILPGPANDLFPLWSPGGGEILFSSDRGGSSGLWALPVENGAAAGEPRLLQGGLGRFLLLGMTGAGDVLLGRRRGGVEIRVASLDGAVKEQILPAPPETDLFGPALSPEGDRLAFIARVRSENFGQEHRSIVVRTLADGTDQEVHARMSHVERVTWSPDGERLLMEGSDHRGRGGVFLFDLASQRPSVVALDPDPGPHGLQATFADANTVLFARRGQLVEKNVDADEERALFTAEPGRRVFLPAVAAGGQGRVFVVAPEKGTGGVLYAERAGEIGRTKLLELPSGRFTDLAWMPSGDALLVGTEGKQGAQLWSVSAAGDSMTPLPTAPNRVPGIALHPSGKALAYAAGKPSEEVWILEHASEAKLAVGR